MTTNDQVLKALAASLADFERMEAQADRLLEEAVGRFRTLPQMQEPGWQPLGSASNRDLVAGEIDRSGQNQLARWYYHQDPTASQAVMLHNAYTFARGVSVKAKDDRLQPWIDLFWKDMRNRHSLTRAAAQWHLNTERQLEGELFFGLFVSTLTGRVTVRLFDPAEFPDPTGIVTMPGDPTFPVYFRRTYMPRWFDFNAGVYKTGPSKTDYYPDFRNAGADLNGKGHGGWVTWPDRTEIYVMHVCTNPLGGRGLTHLNAGLPWIRALKGFMEDRATLTLALATFAFKQKVRGNRQAVQRLIDQWSRYETEKRYGPPGDSRERRQGANTLIENEASSLEQLRTDSGASNAYQDMRMFRQQAGLGAGHIFEHYLGDPSCYSADTEVLTEDGWMRHDEWNGQRVACYNPQTERHEWHHPFELHAFRYQGEMIHFQNAQADILVTPDHRMWTAPNVQWERLPALEEISEGRPGRKRVADGGVEQVNRSWRIEEAHTLLTNPRTHGWRFKAAARFEGVTLDYIDTPIGVRNAYAWARFIGYWLAEGSTLGPTKRDGTQRRRVVYRVMLGQKPGDTLDNMEATLDALGLKYHSATNPHTGVVTLTTVNKALWKYLRDICGTSSRDKRMPRDLLHAGREVREGLFDALMEGDGGNSLRYSTISRQLADDMQELTLSLGYGAAITQEHRTWNGRHHPIWRVWIRRQWLETTIRPHHVSTEPYDGIVYCFQVPHTIYITRRNGKVAIQGNTGNLATSTAMELPMLKMFEFEQQVWEDVIGDLMYFVVLMGLRYGPRDIKSLATVGVDMAGGSPLWVVEPKGAIDLTVTPTLPPIVQSDIAVWANALASVAQVETMTGQQVVPPEQKAIVALNMFGVDDIGAVVDGMKATGFEIAVTPPGEQPSEEQPPGEQPPEDTEERLVAAVREMYRRRKQLRAADDAPPGVGKKPPKDEIEHVEPITRAEIDQAFEEFKDWPELDELLDDLGLSIEDVE